MQLVRVKTKCGNSWDTSFNGSEQEANNYFLNKWFNIGTEDDHMVQVVEVRWFPTNISIQHEIPFALDNGRTYKVTDTKQPYTPGEYPTGGFIIHLKHNEEWVYLDHSPNERTLRDFIFAAQKLPKL